MIESVDVRGPMTLDDYASIAHLSGAVQDLCSEAETLVPRLEGRKIWMVNSTARGGGVAEMLPKIISMLRELGVDAEWLVMGTARTEFFPLTKRIHNLIHGYGTPHLSSEDRSLYETVSREGFEAIRGRIAPDDILVIHDPQPLGMGALVKARLGVPAIWRCHIGLDERLPATSAAWRFLKPYAEVYDHAIFSTSEYIPDYLAGRASIIHPALDPLSHKNRTLSPHKLVGVLCNAGLATPHHPVVTGAFPEPAVRLKAKGRFGSAVLPQEIGLLYRPIVTQVSRWDRLKGFKPLLDGFVRLKRFLVTKPDQLERRHRRRLEILRLVLAGPDPASIQDDPEAQEVLTELIDGYKSLDPELQQDVALLSMPMGSRKFNALMINALQGCSTVVVQNSLREGFGLTATEAMWKRTAVVGTQARGLRVQIRDGIDGRLVHDPEDPAEIAEVLDELLRDPFTRDAYGREAQRRVHQNFLIFTQVSRWLRCMVEQAERRSP